MNAPRQLIAHYTADCPRESYAYIGRRGSTPGPRGAQPECPRVGDQAADVADPAQDDHRGAGPPWSSHPSAAWKERMFVEAEP
jgi:hypothetical protein